MHSEAAKGGVLSAIIFSDTFKTGTYPGVASFCLCCVLFVFYFIIFFLISHHHLLRLFHFPLLIRHHFVDTFHFDITLTTLRKTYSTHPHHFPRFTYSFTYPYIAFSRVLLLFFCNGLLAAAAAAAESEMLEQSLSAWRRIHTYKHPTATELFFLFKLGRAGDRRSDGNKGLEAGGGVGEQYLKKKNEKKHCLFWFAG